MGHISWIIIDQEIEDLDIVENFNSDYSDENSSSEKGELNKWDNLFNRLRDN